jgi:hypothetical protein
MLTMSNARFQLKQAKGAAGLWPAKLIQRPGTERAASVQTQGDWFNTLPLKGQQFGGRLPVRRLRRSGSRRSLLAWEQA